MNIKIKFLLFESLLLILIGPICVHAQQNSSLVTEVPDQIDQLSIDKIEGRSAIGKTLQIENFDFGIQLNPSQRLEILRSWKNDPILKASKGGGSDGGGFKFRYTAIPHYIRNKKFLIKVVLNSPAELFESMGKNFGVQFDQQKLARILETMAAYPARNLPRMNPEGIEEPLSMVYDPLEEKIYALEPFFDQFNKKHLSDEEEISLQKMIIHEASHLFGIGINSDDERSQLFAEEFYKTIIRNYSGDCGLKGTVEERKRMCAGFSVGQIWKYVGYSKSPQVRLYYSEKNQTWVANADVEWESKRKNFPDTCLQIGRKFNIRLFLPKPGDIKDIVKGDQVFRKYLGDELTYDAMIKHPTSIPKMAQARFFSYYTTPENECFPTSDSETLVCKSGKEKEVDGRLFKGEKILCVGKDN